MQVAIDCVRKEHLVTIDRFLWISLECCQH